MSHKILILDDDADFNKLLTNIFSKAKEPYEISPCQDPQKAIALIENGNFDLVVTDHRMPNITGFEFTRRVLEKKPNMPIIMVSAFVDPDTIRQLVNMGICGIFLKPLNVFSLLERTKFILEHNSREEVFGKKSNILVSHTLSTYPCKSLRSIELAGNLQKHSKSGSSFVMVGRKGAPFDELYDDFMNMEVNKNRNAIKVDWNDLDVSALKLKVALLRSDRADNILYVKFPVIGIETSPVNIELLAEVLKKNQEWIDPNVRNFKPIYMLEESPDVLLDKNIINDSLYLLFGASEVRIPSLEEVKDELRYLVNNLLERIKKEKKFENLKIEDSAMDLLLNKKWTRDYRELYETLSESAKSSGTISIEEIRSLLEPDENDLLKDSFKEYLNDRRRDYAQCLFILNDLDIVKTLKILGIDKGTLNKLTEAVSF